MQKPFTWYFENLQKRVEFIHAVLEVSQKAIKKIPRLLNFDEEMIEDQFRAIKVDPVFSKADSAGDLFEWKKSNMDLDTSFSFNKV